MSDGSIKIDTKIDQAGVKKGLNEMNKNVRDTVGKLATFGKASLGVMAAAIGAIAAATGKWLKEADRIDKVSQQIGVTKKTFQELDYVMKQNGASIDAFSIGAKTLQQNMVSNSQAFKTLGVEIRNTDGSLRSQDDVMKDVIRKFETMEQGVEKSALAQDMFGRSALDLMPMLNQQTGSMDELIKKANDMGAVMGDDAVAAAVVLGDTITDLKVSISSLLNTVIAPFVPAIQKVAEWMSNLSGSVSGTIGMHTDLGKATNTLITATNNYKKAVNQLNTESETLSETEKGLIKNRKELASLDIQASLNALSKGYATTNSKILKLDNDRIASGKLVSVNLKRIADLEIAIAQKSEKQKKKDKGTIDDLDAALISARQSATIYNKQQIDADRALTTLKAEQKTAIQGIAKAYKDGLIDISSYKNTNFELYDAIIRASKSIGIATAKEKEATDAAEAAAKARMEQLKLEQEAAEKAAEQIEARKAAQAEYEKAIDISNAKANAGLITQEENTANVNSAAQRYMDTLLSLGYRFGDMATLGGQALEQLRRDLKLTTEETREISEEEEALAAIREKTNKEAAILNDKVLFGLMTEREEREAIVGLYDSQIDALYQMGATSDGSDAKSAALREYIKIMNRMKKVSGDVAPVAEKGLRGVLLAIRDKSSGIVNQVKVMMGKISKVIGSGFSFVKGIFSKGFSFLSKLAKFDPNAMLTSLQEFLSGIENFFTVDLALSPVWLKSAFEMMASFLSGIIQNLPAIMTTFGNAINQLAALIIQYAPTFIESAGQIIMALIKGLADAAPQLVTAAVTVIMSLVKFILENLPELIMAGVQMIVALINGIGQALPSLIYAIVNALPEIIDAIITAFPMIVQAIVDNLPAIIEAVLYAIPMIALALIQAIPELLVAIGKVAYSLIEGLWNGIGAAFTGLFKGLGDLFWEWIIKPIRKLFKMHSPSVVFSDLGGDMIQGLINGILSAGGAIWNAVKGIFTGLWDNIKNVFSGAWDLGKNVVSAIGNGIKGVASGAVNLVKGAGSAIASGASSLISSAGSALSKLKFWDVGSPNISADHVAMVHKGERIVPKTFNQDLMSGNTMMLAPEALSSIMASFTGLGKQSVNISGVVPVMINDREIGRAAFEWLDVAAGGAYGY